MKPLHMLQYTSMITLKSFKLKSRVIQSPMAGCTDLAFRLIAREHGMEFAFLEMVSADALIRENRKTSNIMKTVESDRPLGAQLVGCSAESMGPAAAMIETMGFDVLDLNLGCPVPKIVSPGGGSALLANPEKCKQIFRAVVQNTRKIPVTIKMRKGFSDPSGDEAIRIAKIAEDEGISAISVHGRTRVQAYTGKADWDAIGRIKKSVSIPVFGNGDVNSASDAKKMLKVSNCDGVMVGRGALGNPWLYKSIEAVMEGRPAPALPSFEEIKQTALKHFELELKWEGPKVGMLKCRRILCWYFRNLPGAVEFRKSVNTTHDPHEMRELILGFGKSPSLQ